MCIYKHTTPHAWTHTYTHTYIHAHTHTREGKTHMNKKKGFNREWQTAQFVAVCCSVLQCVAVCCSVLRDSMEGDRKGCVDK